MCINFQTKRITLKIWGQNFKNVGVDSESAFLRYYVLQFSNKTDNVEFLGPNLPKNGSWGHNFKNLSLYLESASIRCCVYQFSDRVGISKIWIRNCNQHLQYTVGANFQCQLLIFRPKFGEIAQLRAIFWFKYCWWCCRELGGDCNELGGGGWTV